MFGTTYSMNTIDWPSSSSSIDNVNTAVTVENIIPYSLAPSCGLPLPLTELYRKEYQHLDDRSQSKTINRWCFPKYYSNFHWRPSTDWSIDSKSARYCTDWFAQRSGRLTASLFHDVLARRSNHITLVKRLLETGNNISLVPAAVRSVGYWEWRCGKGCLYFNGKWETCWVSM